MPRLQLQRQPLPRAPLREPGPRRLHVLDQHVVLGVDLRRVAEVIHHPHHVPPRLGDAREVVPREPRQRVAQLERPPHVPLRFVERPLSVERPSQVHVRRVKVAEPLQHRPVLPRPLAVALPQPAVVREPRVHQGRVRLRRVERRLQLLEVGGEVHLAIQPPRRLRGVEVAGARVHRQAREDVLVRRRPLQEVERLAERRRRLPAVAQHHEVADLDPVLLGELRRLDDLLDGDLLVDLLDDLRRARLHPQAQALAAGEAHLAEQLLAEDVDAGVAAPEEVELALADAAAELEHALPVGGEGVVLDLDHLHRQARHHLLQRVEDVGHRVAAEAAAPRRLRAAEGAGPRAPAGGHHDVGVEVVVRRRERVEVGDGRPIRTGHHPGARSPDRPGDPGGRPPRGEALDQLQERRLALAAGDGVDLRVMGEHLGRQRRGVRAPDQDVSGGVVPAQRPRDEGDAAPVRRPAGHAVEVGVERGQDLRGARPGERRQVEDLDLVPRTESLRPQREQPVRRLIEVRVEVALAVAGRRAVTVGAGGLALDRDLPGRGIEEGDAHRGPRRGDGAHPSACSPDGR